MGRTPEIAENSRNPLIDSIADWLINQALADAPIHDLFEKTCMQLHAAGIPKKVQQSNRGHLFIKGTIFG